MGLSVALHCARRGHHVTVVEASWVGRHASSATAGGVRTLGRAWEDRPLAIESGAMWNSIESLVGDNCGFLPYGQIKVAETPEHLELLERRSADDHARGYQTERIIDARELREIAPLISRHCIGALYAPSDGSADPHRTLRAFRSACSSAGVTIVEGFSVKELRRHGPLLRIEGDAGALEADRVVNCAGAWARKLAALAGEDIPLGHKASMMIVTERVAPFLRPVMSVQGRALSLKQSSQGTVIIGGGLQGFADVDSQLSKVDFIELAKGAKAALDLFPSLSSVRITRTWTGIEAKTSDLLPVIDSSATLHGLWHAFGFSGHGFALVPVVGDIMADLLTRGTTSRPIVHFIAPPAPSGPERLAVSRSLRYQVFSPPPSTAISCPVI